MSVRQGDVYLVAAEAPADATTTEGLVLAWGEVTGHAHRVLTGPDAEAAILTDADNERWLRIVGTGAQIVHEEHGPIAIESGTWRIVIAEEWTDADEPVRVAD